MKGLIKSDYSRVFKDKLFLIVCIIGVAFALIMPLLYLLIFASTDDPMVQEIAGSITTAKSQFFTAFAISDNFGLVVPILLAIILFKDISQGTVRNKIIGGKSRSSIYLSMYTVCFTIMFSVMLLHALLTLGFSLIFFDYQQGAFTSDDILYLLQSLLFELLIFMFVAALVSWLIVTVKNVGLVIVVYAAITLVMSMISAFLMIAADVLSADPTKTDVVRVLETVQKLNIFNYYSYIGSGTSYTLTDTLFFILTPIACTAGLLLSGLRKFNKKDLK